MSGSISVVTGTDPTYKTRVYVIVLLYTMYIIIPSDANPVLRGPEYKRNISVLKPLGVGTDLSCG